MSHARRLERPASMECLRELVDFVVTAAADSGADDATCQSFRLAVEEACTNIIVHGYGETKTGTVVVEVEPTSEELVVRISDEAPIFDPTPMPPPDLAAPWQDREPGGLGWHFVRSTMDRVEHRAAGETGNVLTIARRLAPRDREPDRPTDGEGHGDSSRNAG